MPVALALVGLAGLSAACQWTGNVTTSTGTTIYENAGSPPAPSVQPTPPSATADISDPGPPSEVGAGPLSMTQLTEVFQALENGANKAYRDGSPSELARYMAGTMLTENQASIRALATEGERRIAQVNLAQATITYNSAGQVDFNAVLDQAYAYNISTASNQQVYNAGGANLYQEETISLDPSNHTWYWVGSQNVSASTFNTTSGSTTPSNVIGLGNSTTTTLVP
jgi:hypothetical protein